MREDKVLYIKYEYLYNSAKKLFQKLLPSSITRPIFPTTANSINAPSLYN